MSDTTPRLLIVDDSRIIRSKIERALGDAVTVVGEAADGADAVRQFEALAPDIVTMDITMPHMDGVACIKRIRAKAPTALILVISALSDKATALEAVKSGAVGFLLKPFNDNDLRAAMTRISGRLRV